MEYGPADATWVLLNGLRLADATVVLLNAVMARYSDLGSSDPISARYLDLGSLIESGRAALILVLLYVFGSLAHQWFSLSALARLPPNGSLIALAAR